MNRLALFVLFFACLSACTSKPAEPVIGRDFILKSIQYHDPSHVWGEIDLTFVIEDSLPDGKESRSYEFSLDNRQSKMSYKNSELQYAVWNDSVAVLQGEIDDERALRMRNYYSFLWGLPMKLMDSGTVIDDSVRTEMINGLNYHVVRVPYEKDIWYFYLDQETYRLAAYKFYQDEPNQQGEIIYLDGEQKYLGLKIPANRSWYRTEKPEFLGTDRLLELKVQD